MARKVSAKDVKAWLSDGHEIAFLDVRELGPYSEGHPFFVVPLPYSRLEIDLPRLAPRRSVRMVLLDGGDGIGERAARRAEAMGYTAVHVLDAGAPGWAKAGYTLFAGVNVPSKTFGEVVEIARHTPRITAAELAAMTARGENMVIVDGRTPAEYKRFNIPGGILCPNGELALRIADIVPDPKTTIVVNCAGRTRSIIGAQTLIDLGVPNRVVALENGTQGWFLAGFEVERGASRLYPAAPTAESVAARAKRARTLAEGRGVAFVSAEAVAAWLADETRTTYLLDVRTAEEFAKGSLPGAAHAPGGQLIQATDQWVGVRGARLVLVDADGARAPVVAQWLRQLGHEPSVLEGGVASGLRSPSGAPPAAPLPALRGTTPQGLSALLWAGNARAIDVRASADYRAGHIPGSVWSIRPRIAEAIDDKALPVVLIADDPRVAAAAALDLKEAGIGDVSLLAGGIAAWCAEGQKLNASPDVPGDAERIDFVFHTHRRHDGDAEHARAYLAWEVGLLDQLDAQERGAFRLP